MRAALALSSFLIASPVLAADFELSSKVSEVVAYTGGGLITRDISADLPAGQHRLILDVPEIIARTGQFRFEMPQDSGLRLISSALEVAGQVPERPTKSPELSAAIDELRAARAAFRAHELEQAEARAKQRSAKVRLDYLEMVSLGNVPLFGEDEPSLTAEQFGARIAQMGVQVAAAERDFAEASDEIEAAKARRGELQLDVNYAASKVDALTIEPSQTVRLVLSVAASKPFNGSLALNYIAQAVSWRPNYELDLTQADAKGALTIRRRATVSQATGEDWKDVKLTLSTAAIGEQMQTYLPGEWLQVLAQPQLRRKSTAGLEMSRTVPQMASEPMMVEEDSGFVAPKIKGQTIEFVLNRPQSLRSDTDNGLAQLDIDSIEMSVDLFAKAHAAHDQKGFLYADLVNASGGNFLSGEAFVYRDGAFMGQLSFPAITNGDSADVSFGPLDGLLVERRTVSREDGDRGIISTSNARSLRFETKVTSLLDYPITLQLFDHVPVSESEDLKITEALSPKPSERDVEGKRGVMRWDFDMKPGAIKALAIGYDTVWPEGQTILDRRGR